MRTPLDMDAVGRLGLEARTPERRRRAAEQLIAWATEPHPADGDGVTPAALLAEAGEMPELLGDHGAALDVYVRAATADGVVDSDVRCFVHRALVSVGDLPTAPVLAEEIRRSAPAEIGVYAIRGETYDKAGDLREAHRWMNLGLRRFGRDEPTADPADRELDLPLLAIVRRRIRRALHLPPDAVDRLLGRALPDGRARAGER